LEKSEDYEERVKRKVEERKAKRREVLSFEAA
jgi:hypothetical protein